jgi:hypothetical protein
MRSPIRIRFTLKPWHAFLTVRLPWKVWQYSVNIDDFVFGWAYFAIGRTDTSRIHVWSALKDQRLQRT